MNDAIDRIAGRIALIDLDQWWQSVCSTSLLGKSINGIRTPLSQLSKFGSQLQSLSFLGVPILFGVLALHQFTNDKEGLALIMLSAAGLWMIGYLLGGQERRESVASDIPVWLYLAFNIIAMASSHYMRDSFFGLLKLVVYIVGYFFLTAVFQQRKGKYIQGYFSLVAGGIFQPTKRKYITLAVLGLSALAVVLYGLYQYKIGVAPLATWEDPTVETKGTRIFSTFDNPNLLAGYLVPLAPLAAAVSVAAFSKRRPLIGGCVAGLAALIAAATVLTGSRGAYIGLSIGLAAFIAALGASFWRTHPNKRMLLVATCLGFPLAAVIALHFLVPTFDQRVLSIFAGHEHSSNDYRLKVLGASLQMLKDSWWIGVGPGNKAFVLAYGLYMLSGFDALGTYCVPLEVAVEAGIFSLASFICLIFSVLARGHLCFWSQEAEAEERWLAAGSTAALLAMMAHGCFDTVFYRPQVQFLFWLLVAFLVTAKIKADNKSH